jgi:REP element-mobilizing transposase RayT
MPRVVVPGIPHHLTQRGNRREDVFFSDDDRQRYLQLLLEYSEKHGLETLAYCLMPNHILVCVPEREESLSLVLKPLDMRYAQQVNWAAWLAEKDDEKMLARLPLNTRTGRPAARERFVAELESKLGRRLLAKSVGRPQKVKETS